MSSPVPPSDRIAPAEIDDAGFVEYCYTQLLGRPSDPDGKTHWLTLLQTGRLSRLQLLETFVASDEYRNRRTSPFVQFAPPGHFNSPLPSMDDVTNYEARTIKALTQPECPGIDLRADAQIALLRELAGYYGEQPFTEQASAQRRYYFANDSFIYQDGLVLYALLRHFRPRQVLEVGAGFSSAVMLDTNELFFDGSMRLSMIEPHPQRLNSILHPADHARVRMIPMNVQDIPLSEFARLGENDVLFIDSSHVVKFGSDVAFLLFEVLPVLTPGVIVHFHDIFWPFEYPEAWLREGRAWNEVYFIRAFLSFNTSFEILCFNSFLARFYRDLVNELSPLALKGTGGSLWLRKLPRPAPA